MKTTDNKSAGIVSDKTICPFCAKEVTGPFRDPRSLREYKISGICQPCQDNFFGTEDKRQVCEECQKVIPEGEEILMGNYAVCSGDCAKALVGV